MARKINTIDVLSNKWSESKAIDIEFTWNIDKNEVASFPNILTSPVISYYNLKWEVFLRREQSGKISLWLRLKESTETERVSVCFSCQGKEFTIRGYGIRVADSRRKEFVLSPGEHDGFSVFTGSSNELCCHYAPCLQDHVKLMLRLQSTEEFIGRTCLGRLPHCNRHLNISKTDQEFLTNVQDFFLDEKMSDVTILANGDEFKAHRIILASRSVIFKGMFSHDLRENNEQQVNLSYMEADIVREMLRYIYTGSSSFEVPINDNNARLDIAIDLIKAADKFQLDNLKSMCSEYLCENLLVESAAEVLALANLYRISGLEECAFRFIKLNVQDVIKTEGWINFCRKNPELVGQLLGSIIKQKSMIQ